jgi:hypothetical protein
MSGRHLGLLGLQDVTTRSGSWCSLLGKVRNVRVPLAFHCEILGRRFAFTLRKEGRCGKAAILRQFIKSRAVWSEFSQVVPQWGSV